jgi:hypothetical protein
MQQVATQSRLPLVPAAKRANLTPAGLLKILRRSRLAIRDDGKWFVNESDLDVVIAARRTLGLARCQPARPIRQKVWAEPASSSRPR